MTIIHCFPIPRLKREGRCPKSARGGRAGLPQPRVPPQGSPRGSATDGNGLGARRPGARRGVGAAPVGKGREWAVRLPEVVAAGLRAPPPEAPESPFPARPRPPEIGDWARSHRPRAALRREAMDLVLFLPFPPASAWL